MMKYILYLLFLFVSYFAYAQNTFRSIHIEEAARYDTIHSWKETTPLQTAMTTPKNEKTTLNKRVFGYHPYWSGSKYLNYQWDKLTDICYFSYEVDPNTGEAANLHDYLTSPAIDSAIANNVKVHLCITLFSGHSSFFSSETAQQTLIDNCINLLQVRGADGINLDFEAVPSSLGDEYTAFTANLDAQMETALPDAELSMATYAVNWSNTYQVEELNNYLDFFMVMSYDYYWNGSSYAGPIGSFYSMTSSFNYSFSRTISYYESEGVPSEKILAGMPYYGRTWKTQGPTAPSSTIGNATAKTYTYYRNNSSGHFSDENKKWEPNSFAPYYSYQVGENWYQAFIDDTYSLGKRYHIVNRRNLGGIGIWALGYDNGYTDLWDLIGEKFSTFADTIISDTIYDSGGPSWNHYNKEDYLYQITLPQNEIVLLRFDAFDLEPEYDSLWIYDGDSTNTPLLAALSGNTFPIELQASGNKLLLHFHSDNATTEAGWVAHYLPLSMHVEDDYFFKEQSIFPNPSSGLIKSPYFKSADIEVFNSLGERIKSFSSNLSTTIVLSNLKQGVYFIKIRQGKNNYCEKIIIR